MVKNLIGTELPFVNQRSGCSSWQNKKEWFTPGILVLISELEKFLRI